MLIAADHPNRATACVVSGQVLALILLAVLGTWGSISSLAVVPVVAEVVVLSGMLLAVWRIRTPSTPGRHAKKQHAF